MVEIGPGGPNEPTFTPCAIPKPPPWISVETEIYGIYEVRRGQRRYYFACGFSDSNTLTASITGPDGTQQLRVLDAPLNPDLQTGPQRVAVWNATCDLTLGSYTLTMQDGQGGEAQLTFDLKTKFQNILTVDQSGPAGTTFQIYYCGYEDYAGQDVVIDFYYETGRQPDGTYEFKRGTSWTVPINDEGWAQQELQSLSDDPARAYLLLDREEVLKGWDVLWLK